MIVVGVSGKLQSGKSTIAARLVERWGFVQISMADALREEVLDRFPLLLGVLHDRACLGYEFRADPALPRRRRPCLNGDEAACIREMLYESKPPGIRELLQEYGTGRRTDDRDYWVARWCERAERYAAESTSGSTRPNIVIPDVRFPNEARLVLGLGGVLWRVERTRSGCARTHGVNDPEIPDSSHASETSLDSWNRWDSVLRNDGTLANLHARVDALMASAETDRQLHVRTPHLVASAPLDPAV